MNSLPLTFGDFLRTMRPSQWTKNLIVFAAFFFAYFDKSRVVPLQYSDLLRVIPAVAIFCIISSAIYIINDIHDMDADRAHPLKRFRPIPAGRISVPTAWCASAILLALGLAGAFLLTRGFALVAASYVLAQLVYTFWLKKVALVDVLLIAAGFVLRAVAGALVLDNVTISAWLLTCTFLLALFLGLCKRRHEKVTVASSDNTHRPSLEKYNTVLLDILIAVTSATTIGSYAVYTIWPETVRKFGSDTLSLTVPFVIFGIFRYLYLVYRQEKGDRPEKILLTDVPLLVNIVLYGATVILLLRFLSRWGNLWFH